jgi:tRNA(Ile)-lysidine synthase
MRSLDTMLTQLAREELGRHRKRGAIEVVRLNSLPVALRAAVVRVFLSEHGIGLARISRKHVDAALKLAIGQPAAKSIDIPGGRRLIRDGSKLKIEARRLAGEPQDFEVRLKSSGRTRVPQAGFEFVARIETAKSAAMPASLSEAVFDRAVVRERGMRVRPVQSGDRIAPLGMSGTRKLSDIYIDRKVKRQRRANWPVVVLGDEICWIPGLVRGRAGLVNPSSKAIVRLAAREYGG